MCLKHYRVELIKLQSCAYVSKQVLLGVGVSRQSKTVGNQAKITREISDISDFRAKTLEKFPKRARRAVIFLGFSPKVTKITPP